MLVGAAKLRGVCRTSALRAWECGLAPTLSGWGAANGGLNEAGSLAQGYGQREGAVVRA